MKKYKSNKIRMSRKLTPEESQQLQREQSRLRCTERDNKVLRSNSGEMPGVISDTIDSWKCEAINKALAKNRANKEIDDLLAEIDNRLD